jgi:hypothetical protein
MRSFFFCANGTIVMTRRSSTGLLILPSWTASL